MQDLASALGDNYVQIELTTSDSITGVVINRNADFVAIKEYVDFNFRGVKVIPVSFVAKIEQVEPVSVLSEIVKRENLSSLDAKYSFVCEVDSWESLLKQLFWKGVICMFYEIGSLVHLGRLLSPGCETLGMICIDHNFRYENRPFNLERGAISMVEIGSEYIRIYETYSTS